MQWEGRDYVRDSMGRTFQVFADPFLTVWGNAASRIALVLCRPTALCTVVDARRMA